MRWHRLMTAGVRKTALNAHSPPILRKRAGGGATERGTKAPWGSSPLLNPPLAPNKMAFNQWNNSTSPDVTQPRTTPAK